MNQARPREPKHLEKGGHHEHIRSFSALSIYPPVLFAHRKRPVGSLISVSHSDVSQQAGSLPCTCHKKWTYLLKNSSQTAELLHTLGLSEGHHLVFETESRADTQLLARVIILHGNHAEVALVVDEKIVLENANLSHHLPHTPVAGDWVLVTQENKTTTIVNVAHRYTELARPSADGLSRQALASNIDTVLLVVSVEKPPSLKAIEKLMIMGWDSGATPVLVLSKIDACENLAKEMSRIENVSVGVETICCSVKTGEGLSEISQLVSQGTTTMLGASGVGKTSLLNALEGTDATTFEVRRDGQGRHTTTTRKLYMLSGGGVMLDVPGIRSLTVDVSNSAVEETFADISALANHCRFSDCQHDGDFGCAVEAAIDAGELPARRLESWQGVQRELAYQRRRNNPREMAEQRKQWKQQTKNFRKKS